MSTKLRSPRDASGLSKAQSPYGECAQQHLFRLQRTDGVGGADQRAEVRGGSGGTSVEIVLTGLTLNNARF